MSDHLRLTREELYSLVWAKPMTEVGQDFQISDRAMAKICARKQVPVPPRGYWAKKNAGKSVLRSPLPEFVVKQPKERKGDSRRNDKRQRSENSPACLKNETRRSRKRSKNFVSLFRKRLTTQCASRNGDAITASALIPPIIPCTEITGYRTCTKSLIPRIGIWF